MPHHKFTAAALAILAFAAASPAFAQTDDVIVDGRIITGENPASAAPKPFDPQFLGGVNVSGAGKDGPGGLKGKAAKSNANPAPHRGGVKVAVGDVNGDASQAGRGSSRHVGGVNVLMGDGSVRSGGGKSGAGKIAGATPQANAGEQPPPPPPPPPPSNGGASPLPVLLVIADQRDFYSQADRGLADQPAGGSAQRSGGANGKLFVGTDQGVYAPKTGSLGSLNSVGSIGQLAAPPGAPPAQAQNNIRQLGLAAHNYDSSGGDVNGDGVKDIVVGTGKGSPHVKAIDGNANAGAKGATHVKVFDGTRATGPKVGGAPQVKADGNPGAAGVGGVVKGFTLTSKGTK